LQDGSYNGHLLCSKWSQLNVEITIGQYTTQFQAEVYATQACAVENVQRCYLKRNMYILSDSDAAIKALDNCEINYKLV
jgi:hypothetical protein